MSIPNEWDLTGKRAIITADRRGWTPYFASALAEAGADVAVAGSAASDMAEAAAAVESQRRRGLAIETDLTDAASVYEMANTAVSGLGGIDILINNARAEFGKRFELVSEDEWDRFMAFAVKSMFLTCQAVGGRMLEQGSGHIVNIGSGSFPTRSLELSRRLRRTGSDSPAHLVAGPRMGTPGHPRQRHRRGLGHT